MESLMKKKREFMPPRFMSVSEASEQLLEILKSKREAGDTSLAYDEETIFVGLARVGHESQRIFVCSLQEMKESDLGKPLHSLILPSTNMHPIEKEYLQQFCLKPL